MRKYLDWIDKHVFIFVVIGLAIIVGLWVRVDQNATSTYELNLVRREADLRACDLANVILINNNRLRKRDYEIRKPLEGYLIHENLKTYQKAYALAVLARVVTDEWAPINNCKLAVIVNGKYSAPTTVLFTKEQPPKIDLGEK